MREKRRLNSSEAREKAVKSIGDFFRKAMREGRITEVGRNQILQRLMPLTDKQQRFVQEYTLDLNATQAAIRAGYSEKTARADS